MKKLLTTTCMAVLVLLQIGATEPFRLHRYDMFHALPVRSTDIVMMGNSITDMPNWPEFFNGAQGRVINRGNSGGFSYEMLANIESVLVGKPAKIFMKIGTNDLGGSTGTPASIAANVRQCVERCKAESPETEFYIESIIPAYNQGIKTPQTIAEANRLLKAIADEDENDKCFFVELNSLFGGAVTSLPSNCTLDNLHLSAGGYKIWCDAIVGNMGAGASVVLPKNIATTQKTCGLGHPNGTRNTYFSGVPVTSDDILVVGDEMIKCGEWQELLGNNHVLNRGYGWGYGGQISVVKSSLEAIFNGGTPKAVYLYTGTADLNNGASALETNKTNYSSLVKAIRAKVPNATIVLMGNLPINDATINSGSIKPFNQWLKEQASADSKMEYIDLYTPFVNAGTNNMNTRYLTAGDGKAYLYGLGYAKVAELMKPTLDAITGVNNDVVTESEAEALIATYTARAALGNAITSASRMQQGTGLGYYPQSAIDAVEKAVAQARALLSSNEATPEQIQAAAATISTTVNGQLENINQPAGDDTWYTFCTPLRAGLFLTTQGVGRSVIGAQVDDIAKAHWRFVKREDGDWDIQNRDDKGYIVPQTTQNAAMSTAANSPSKGWKLSYSNTPGFYILNSGNVQMNQTGSGQNYQLYNWSANYTGQDRTDTGCQFLVEVAPEIKETGKDPVIVPADSYIIDKEHGALYRGGTENSTGWCSQWKSQDGVVTFTSNANNMQWNSNNLDARSGSAQSSTYTLATTNSAYVITEYGFNAKALANDQVWAQGGESTTVTSAGVTPISATGLEAQSVNFVLTGANTGTLLTDFYVKLKEVEKNTELTEPDPITVFATPTSGVPYRIPAIASTNEGVLVAIADYRYSKADIGSGRIDLHIRRSFDYGKTWEDQLIKPSNMIGDGKCSNGNDYAGFGDPCMVADRTSSKIIVLSCSGYPGFFSCTRDQHQRCARWYSEDNGATWSGPEFIDNTYVFEPLDGTSFGPAQGMFFGSGKIHQSRYVKVGDYYRLYAANSVRNGSGTIRNYVMYSDDFGQTWEFLGGVNGPAVSSGGDEPKVEELPNGNVIFSGRVNGGGGRNINIFKFTNREKAEGKWMTKVVSNASVNGITNDNACNGEIQLVPVVRKSDNAKMWLALQSVPFGSGRNNVGIFYKPLDAENKYDTPTHFASNWEGRHQSSWTSSCYSSMTVQGDKTIGFIYEENGKNSGYDIQYKNYSIELITDGKYSYDTEYDPVSVVLPLSSSVVTPVEGNVEKIDIITVGYNKPLTLKKTEVILADGVTAKASVDETTLTLTLTKAISEKGKYSLTIPEGVVEDADKQQNKELTLTYRILGEALPLGSKVTTLNGVDEHTTYALYNPGFTSYAIYAPQYDLNAVFTAGMIGDSGHKVSNPAYSEECNFADPNTAWMLINYEGKQYLYNVGAEKFVKTGYSCQFVDAQSVKVTCSNGIFNITSGGGNQDYMCVSPQLSTPINVWTSSDNGSKWEFYENPNVEAEYEACIEKIMKAEGVNLITNKDKEANSTFDLQGRRVEGLTRRGLYIIGGRKVMVK